MKQATAAHVINAMQSVTRELSRSAQFVIDNEDADEGKKHWKMVSKIVADILMNITVPLFKQYPDLTPEELRSEYKSFPQ